MVSRLVNIITGLIGLLLVSVFVIGLSHSISIGFAGFLGGLPFALIVAFVLSLAGYEFWNECLRKKRD
ncbi:hypothetical protein ACFL17_00125 [Pseudomonadota bacterium]